MECTKGADAFPQAPQGTLATVDSVVGVEPRNIGGSNGVFASRICLGKSRLINVLHA